MHNPNATRKTLHPSKIAPKAQPWSHQQELERLVGKTLHFFLRDTLENALMDTSTSGVLLAVDQYSVKVRNGTHERVIFKHAIATFSWS